MDEYTLKTKAWLNDKFSRTDESGVYCAHQPIYGFRVLPCEYGIVSRYIRTYHILRALSRLKFSSLLDVGAAEGYKAAIAKEFFDVTVACSDLSEAACKRTEDIYKIKAVPADIHDLPFADNEFDVVMCSETLEHVTDYRKAAAELLRVARKAVIVTVPHEPEEKIEENINTAKPHSHIHTFSPTSFDYLKQQNIAVKYWKVHSRSLWGLSVFVDAIPLVHQEHWKFPKFATCLFNHLLVPMIRIFTGKRTAARLILKDEKLCQTTDAYTGFVYMLLKDPSSFEGEAGKPIDPMRLINFSVPYHYLKK